jgi:hypothetical protein
MLISRVKKAVWLVAISAFAATVMPTASLAEEELDPASGDFTVNVYADLDEFGTFDPCEGFGGASSLAIQDEYEDNWSLGEDRSREVILENAGFTEFPATTEPGLFDLFAFYNLSMFTDIPLALDPFDLGDDGVSIVSVTYITNDGQNVLEFDVEPYGVIDSTELAYASSMLSEARTMIYAPDYDVSFDADDCEFSESFGVLTSARSNVLYQESAADVPSSIEIDFSQEPGDVVFDGGTAAMEVGSDIIGQPNPVQKLIAFEPFDSTGTFGGHTPTLIAQSGTQPISAFMHIFGEYPAGIYSMNLYHKLYVDPFQYNFLICMYDINAECEG